MLLPFTFAEPQGQGWSFGALCPPQAMFNQTGAEICVPQACSARLAWTWQGWMKAGGHLASARQQNVAGDRWQSLNVGAGKYPPSQGHHHRCCLEPGRHWLTFHLCHLLAMRFLSCFMGPAQKAGNNSKVLGIEWKKKTKTSHENRGPRHQNVQ